jgi:hypothetical protein
VAAQPQGDHTRLPAQLTHFTATQGMCGRRAVLGPAPDTSVLAAGRRHERTAGCLVPSRRTPAKQAANRKVPQGAVVVAVSRRRLLHSRNGSVDKFLAHHFSVRPFLNGYLAHVECTPLSMIGIDPINNERLVARNHVAVANVGPNRLDLR